MPRAIDGPEAAIEKMIDEAGKTLGWSDKNNTAKTPVHTWYEGKFGNPDPGKYAWDWCDGWVTYVAWHAGQEKAVRCLSGQSYTVAHAQAFKSSGEWHAGAEGIRRGDIVFFDWGSGIEHVGIVTGATDTGEVQTIEGNTLNVVAKRSRARKDIAGYGRPKYGAPAPTTPEVPTVPGKYTAPAFPAGLRPDSAKPSAKGLQAALKAAGYMQKGIAPADNYGPSTQAAVALFHRAHPAISEAEYDPEIGPTGWKVLHEEAYGGADKPKVPAPAPQATESTAGEPAHDYRRVTYGGKTVNVRTKVMLQRAQGLMSRASEFPLTQGSYNKGVAASAGTHDGGGCVDINTNGLNVSVAVQALRKAGFAAWYRTPAQGFSPHIHAVAIGDRELASVARSQVVSYFNGRDGLAGNRADSTARPYPKWAAKYR